MNLNKVFVLGNVTRDPEVRSLPSGQQVTSFGMATNRFYTANGEKKQEAEFHNIVCFGKLADIGARYLNKGSLVLVEGRIKTRNWDDKTTGAKHYKTEIIADSMQLGPRGNNVTGSSAGSSSGYNKKPYSAPEPDMPQSEEIPVIEEDHSPVQDGPVSFEDGAADEIDIKDIPF
jgi:single-strand DNA-binding protein